jgi:6-phosphogluconolactonase
MLSSVVAKDAKELAEAAAAALARSVDRVLEQRDRCVLGVPGGRSAGAVFTALRDRPVPWERVHVFMADERLVPIESPDSNFSVVGAALIDPLRAAGRLPAGNVHPFVTDPAQPDGGVAAYSRLLARHGGRYDVVLLSAGEDGHVASLFPRHRLLEAKSPHVLVEDAPKPPPRRMSMSLALLRTAAAGVLVFAGEGKRMAYRAFSDPAAEVAACPAVAVKGLSEAYVLTDLTAG